MKSSTSIARILGLGIVIGLAAAYGFSTRHGDIDAPIELHHNAAAPKNVPASAGPARAGRDVAALLPDPSTPIEMPAPAAAPAPAASLAEKPAPKFDVVRVEPTGEAVIAGHTEPDAQVAVLSNGKVIAEGKADAAGQFVLLPPPLPPGDHGLTLQATPPAGQRSQSEQHVAVSVPKKGQGEVMVALAEPGKPTVLLADPTAKAEEKSKTEEPLAEDPAKRGAADAAKAAKPDVQKPDAQKAANAKAAEKNQASPKESKDVVKEAAKETAKTQGKEQGKPQKPEVAIKTAEIVEPGGFFATGIAAAGAHLRLYLNGSALAEVKAAADGHWSVKVGKGLIPGHYAVRADQLDASGGVVARAEVPFDYAPAQAASQAPSQPQVAAAPVAVAPPAPAAVTTTTTPAASAAPAGPAVTAPASAASIQKEAAHPAAIAAVRQPEKPAANNAAAAPLAPVQEADARSSASAPEVRRPNNDAGASDASAPAASVAAASESISAESASPDSAAAVVAEVQTTTVEKGNSLWLISRQTLGHGTRYTEIYAANSTQIRDPKLIYPGQVFIIPTQTN